MEGTAVKILKTEVTGMEQLQGLVEHIVYHNDDNGYTVLNLMCQGSEVVCVGTMPVISEGEYIKAEGDYVEHATY